MRPASREIRSPSNSRGHASGRGFDNAAHRLNLRARAWKLESLHTLFAHVRRGAGITRRKIPKPVLELPRASCAVRASIGREKPTRVEGRMAAKECAKSKKDRNSAQAQICGA